MEFRDVYNKFQVILVLLGFLDLKKRIKTGIIGLS